MGINKAEQYSKRIAEALQDMAADYQEMADGLRYLETNDVPRIGQQQGLSEVTATGIVVDALRRINRGSLSLTALVRAAADYERHVGLEVDG